MRGATVALSAAQLRRHRENVPPPRDFRVQVQIRSGDFVYWMEIPFNDAPIFRSQFIGKPPLNSDPAPEVLSALDGADAGTGLRRQGRVLWGSHDATVYRLLPRRPFFAVLLRDPVERVLTAYREMRNRPSGPIDPADLEAFLDDPKVEGELRNRQVRQLAGCVEGGPRGLSQSSMLDLASARLTEFTFVGLHDRWEDSLELLHHTLALAAPTPGLAPQAGQLGSAVLSPRLAMRIRTWSDLDMELLVRAGREFDAVRRETARERREVRRARWQSWRKAVAMGAGRRQFAHSFLAAFLADAGRIRRKVIPPGSKVESHYLAWRRRFLGW